MTNSLKIIHIPDLNLNTKHCSISGVVQRKPTSSLSKTQQELTHLVSVGISPLLYDISGTRTYYKIFGTMSFASIKRT
jgi:hypothetical protein